MTTPAPTYFSLSAAPPTGTTALLTAEQTALLRAELGPDLDLTDAQTRYGRLGDTRQVVLEILRERLAALLNGPASYSISGVYSQDTSANIAGLREQLTRIGTDPLEGGGLPTVTRISTRPRRSR